MLPFPIFGGWHRRDHCSIDDMLSVAAQTETTAVDNHRMQGHRTHDGFRENPGPSGE